MELIRGRIMPAKLTGRIIGLGLLVLVAVTASFGPGGDAANAQGGDEDYVDLELTLGYVDRVYDPDLDIIVMNHGTRAAYDVEVVVDIVSPKNTVSFRRPYRGRALGGVSIGHVSMEGTLPAVSSGAENGNGYTLRWTIPELPGLGYGRVTTDILTFDQDITQHPRVDLFDEQHTPVEFYGEVTTSSFESELRRENNTDRIWTESTGASSSDLRVRATPDYKIESLSVDELSPSPGDIVNFTFEADPDRNIDSRVTIGLTDGLTIDEDPDATPAREITTVVTAIHYGGTPGPVSYSDGVFTIGTRPFDEGIGRLTATLPVRVASDAGGTQQCLTVTITGNPPTGGGPYYDDISDNVAKLCLNLGAVPAAGEQVVLDDGTVDLFTWYDCVGKTAGPCQENDLLELVALSDTVLQPSQMVVHVPDPAGRTEDANGTLIWSTGFESFGNCGVNPSKCLPGGRDRPGVRIAFNSRLMDIVSDTGDPGKWGADYVYSGTTYQIGEVQTGSFDVPTGGQVSLYYNNQDSLTAYFCGGALLVENTPCTPWWIGYDWAGSDVLLEFTKLGTYELPFTITAPYDSDGGGPNNPVSPQPSDTETYIFHVGPIQDLSVVDGGSSSDVASGRTAYTILAANNGPGNTAAAQVKVAVPPGAQVESYVASDGTYSNGVWTLPGLKSRDYRSSQGKSEEAMLTLILKDGGIPREPATATISLTDNSYTVCISTLATPWPTPVTRTAGMAQLPRTSGMLRRFASMTWTKEST